MGQAWLYGSGIALFALAFAALGWALAGLRALPRPAVGPRGLARGRWLDGGGLGGLEGLLRLLAGACAQLRPPASARLHAWLERLLQRAGVPLGLCADECLALCLTAAAAGAAIAASLGCGLAASAACAAAAGALPLLKLGEHARLRERAIARRLPAAIDLMALCMGAGLDFIGALRLLTEGAHALADDPLDAELRRMQQELALGRTRQQVLHELAERVPAAAVRDFVHAVIQAEQKGNPLCDVLQVQAQMLRMRRSIAAEEAAARAGVLLALPLLLLMSAVLVLMFGPFVVRGVGL
jgi:tight adherence protein C